MLLLVPLFQSLENNINLHDIEQISSTNRINNFELIGCTINMQDQMIDIVKAEYPDKEYIIVDHWCWNHISLNEVQLQECKLAGVFPDFISSDAIIFDSMCNHDGSIASSFILNVINNCIMITERKCIILVNNGTFITTTLNNTINPPLVHALYE